MLSPQWWIQLPSDFLQIWYNIPLFNDFVKFAGQNNSKGSSPSSVGISPKLWYFEPIELILVKHNYNVYYNSKNNVCGNLKPNL